MLGGYGAAYPLGSTLERAMEAVKLGALMQWLTEKGGFMQFVGVLDKMFPGKEMQDIFDIAETFWRNAGRFKNQLVTGMKSVEKLKALGFGGKEAMGGLMAGIMAEQGARPIGAMVSILEKPFTVTEAKRGRKLTEQQQIQNMLAGMNAQQRLAWIRPNIDKATDIFGPSIAIYLPALMGGRCEAGTEMVRQAQIEDAYRKSVREFGKQGLGRLVQIEAEQLAGGEQLQLEWGRGAARGLTWQYTTDILSKMPWIGGTERKLIEAAIEVQGRFGGDYIGAAVENLSRAQKRFTGKTRILPSVMTTGGFPSGPREIVNPYYNPAAADVVQQLIERISKIPEAFEQINSTQGQGTVNILCEIRDELKVMNARQGGVPAAAVSED